MVMVIVCVSRVFSNGMGLCLFFLFILGMVFDWSICFLCLFELF